MEQKHIDEVEEDSFGEEFIDEDYPVLKVDKKKEEKKSATPTFKPKAAAPAKKKPVVFETEDFDDDDEEEIQIKPAKIEPKVMPRSEPKVEPRVEPKVEPKPELKKESISITPAISSDPDKSKGDAFGESMFGKVSTWVVISLTLLILLIASIYSNGFGYDSSSSAVDKISRDAAEEKVLNYVNTNLLAPPFVAEVKDKKEVGNMYKFTLSVAGQEVESYVTVDGKLFFPRGFELNENNSKLKEEPLPVVGPVKNTTAAVAPSKPIANSSTNTSTPAVATPAPAATPLTVSYNLTAKKWLFDPNTITVKKGQKVKLTIKPLEMGEFTFSVSGLGVEKKISGETTIELTTDKIGTYKFLCSSCQGWLKDTMQGTLVVE